MRVDIRLAQRLELIKPSSTLAITSRAKKLKAEGLDIVNLSAGEPDFDTLIFRKDAAVSAIGQGFTNILPTAGILELRQHIRKVKKIIL